jgi:hypothetical protein
MSLRTGSSALLLFLCCRTSDVRALHQPNLRGTFKFWFSFRVCVHLESAVSPGKFRNKQHLFFTGVTHAVSNITAWWGCDTAGWDNCRGTLTAVREMKRNCCCGLNRQIRYPLHLHSQFIWIYFCAAVQKRECGHSRSASSCGAIPPRPRTSSELRALSTWIFR